MLARQLPKLACLALVVCSLTFTSMQLYPIYLAQQTSESPLVTPTNTQVLASSSRTTNKKTHRIEEFSLFGSFDAQPIVTDTPKDLPTTKLRLTLTGVSASNNNALARALIVGPDKNTESYRVGDTLPGSASLHEVHSDRIVLSRSGKLETLYFPNQSATRLISLETTSADEPDQTSPSVYSGVNQKLDYNKINTNFDPAQKQSIKNKLSALRAKLKSRQ